MEISSTVVQGRVPVTIFRMKGSFDSASADSFDQAARQAVAGGAADIMLDFTNVDFMSSIGLRSISALYDALHPGTEEEKKAMYQEIRAGTYKAPHLKLLKPNKRILNSMQLTGLNMYLEIFNDEKEALKAF